MEIIPGLNLLNWESLRELQNGVETTLSAEYVNLTKLYNPFDGRVLIPFQVHDA